MESCHINRYDVALKGEDVFPFGIYKVVTNKAHPAPGKKKNKLN